MSMCLVSFHLKNIYIVYQRFIRGLEIHLQINQSNSITNKKRPCIVGLMMFMMVMIMMM